MSGTSSGHPNRARLTIYRHFANDDAIFAACSAHWLAGQVPPDPSAWRVESDPLARIRVGLAELYRFYRDGEAMLTRVYRDKASIPASRRQALDDRDGQLRDLLVEPFTVDTDRRRRLRAILAHAVSFRTWRSLCVEQGLSNSEAVDAMTALTHAIATGRDAP